MLSRDCTRGFAWVLCCVDWSERVWCWSLWKGYCSVVQCSVVVKCSGVVMFSQEFQGGDAGVEIFSASGKCMSE